MNQPFHGGAREFRLAGITFSLHPTVFGVSAALIAGFVALTLINLDSATMMFEYIKQWITTTLGWMLILFIQGFLIFCAYLALSRFGHIRIGGAGARPDFSRWSWFSMLFSAGMGIGLMFWSVAEPIFHFSNPPAMEGGSAQAAARAMDLTFLHWGLHAWSVYALVGLALAYFAYNRKLPLTIRSVFHPVFGDRIYGPIGTVIDVMAVVATLFGVATSLGFGVSQISAGLNFVFGLPDTTAAQMGLIAVITGLATISVVSGLDKGIKRLSQLNLLLALLLMLFVLIGGPTLFLVKSFVQNTGHYLQNLLILGSWTQSYQMDASWQGNWTVFYWAWWISWSPFVGMFIARISRGRTVREFILGVLFVPAILTFLWISVFGGAAIYDALFGAASVVAAVNENVATATFRLFELYPFTTVTSLVGITLVFVFFITSSDSGSLVIDIITAGGNLNPPVAQRVFWAVTEGVVAAVLLAGGGLLALQTASIITGLPFAIVLVIMCFGLHRAFNEDIPPIRHSREQRIQQLPDADLQSERNLSEK